MKTVDTHEARARLRRLIEAASRGEDFIIVRAGRPLVRVSAISGATSETHASRIGFLEREAAIPHDFEQLCAEDIRDLFEGRGASG